MALLDAGLTATLSREFARKDIQHVDKLQTFKTLESTYFIVISVCIAIVFLLSGTISEKWLNIKTYNPNQISYFLKIISFEIGFQLLLRFYMGGLLGLERQIRANMFQVGWGMLRNGLVVVGIVIIPTLEMFFLWQTISTVIFTVLMKLSLEKILNGKYIFNISLKIEKAVFQRSWQFAGGMMLIAIIAALNTQMDKIAISKLLSLESLGYYTLAISVSQVIIVLVNPIATALLPHFTAEYSAGRNEGVTKLFYKISLLVSILVFSIMANMVFFAKEIIWIWTGKAELAEHISEIIPVVAFGYTMLSLQVIPYQIAIAKGYTKLNNLLGIISLFVTLPGYWILTKYYGALGAASVFCLVQIVTTFIYIYFINKKFLNPLAVSNIFGKHIVLPLLITLCVAYGFSHVPQFIMNSRLISLVWIGISTTITLIVTLSILVPLKELKDVVKNKLS
jgi:O-antigen/teichoic acid export membrane protein